MTKRHLRVGEDPMRRFSSFVAILFFVIAAVVVAPAAAQEADLDAILNRINEFYAAGHYPAALVEAQKFEARVKAQFGTNHVYYAVALGTLSRVYGRQGKYAEAEAHSKRALAI